MVLNKLEIIQINYTYQTVYFLVMSNTFSYQLFRPNPKSSMLQQEGYYHCPNQCFGAALFLCGSGSCPTELYCIASQLFENKQKLTEIYHLIAKKEKLT
jgi:hypothetical protein